MEEEQLLKSGERINQLFSTDIKIIQIERFLAIRWIVFSCHAFHVFLRRD